MSTEITTYNARPSSAPVGLVPQTFGEATKMAEIMARSTLVPKDFQGNPGNVLVAIQWGGEIGLAPLQAMQNIAVINGRPSIFGDAMLALVRGSGLLEFIREDVTDTAAVCTIKRRGEPETSRTFSLEDAKRAGLLGKSGPWSQYPKRMMQMRARSWALRDTFPDVLRGLHIAEEAQDIPIERPVTTATVVDEPTDEQPASRTAAVKAKLRGRRQTAEPEAPTLASVVARIEGAETEGELQAVVEVAGRLADEDDRAKARAAYRAKLERLRAGAEVEQEPAQGDEQPGSNEVEGF